MGTYLERDLRSQMRVGSLRDFERFVRAAALLSAQLLNKAELAGDVGLSGTVLLPSNLESPRALVSLFLPSEFLHTMSHKRKRLFGAEKIAIVKQYIVERVPISDLCDQHGIQPSQIYRWQAAAFEHGADAFDLKRGRNGRSADIKQHLFCKSGFSEAGHLASMFR